MAHDDRRSPAGSEGEAPMPIVHFDYNHSRVPADAQNVRAVHNGAGYRRGRMTEKSYVYDECAGPTQIVLWDTHTGLCLSEFERNGYDDSDFFMVVWNPEKAQPETIMFA